jgi:hypothetical protein
LAGVRIGLPDCKLDRMNPEKIRSFDSCIRSKYGFSRNTEEPHVSGLWCGETIKLRVECSRCISHVPLEPCTHTDLPNEFGGMRTLCCVRHRARFSAGRAFSTRTGIECHGLVLPPKMGAECTVQPGSFRVYGSTAQSGLGFANDTFGSITLTTAVDASSCNPCVALGISLVLSERGKNQVKG